MKIAFIESKFHQKTKSSLFFKELISSNNELVVIVDDPYSDSIKISPDELSKQNFDAIIFWQFIKSPTSISKIKCRNIIWIPMYDGEISRKFKKIRLSGYSSLNLKIISFSESLTKIFKDSGFTNILNVQYFPENNIEKKSNNDENSILFWQRTKDINWNIVKNIIKENKIKNITIKRNFDVGHFSKITITEEEQKKYNIKIINDWLDKNQYIEVLKNHNIFIEPRIYEGIGMGFIDAMSYGAIVISPDESTMNEYIKDGYNGYLYDIKNPKPINLNNILLMKKNLEEYIINGRQKWVEDIENIIYFIENKNIKTKYKISISYALCGIPLEFLIKLKRKIMHKY